MQLYKFTLYTTVNFKGRRLFFLRMSIIRNTILTIDTRIVCVSVKVTKLSRYV